MPLCTVHGTPLEQVERLAPAFSSVTSTESIVWICRRTTPEEKRP